MSAGKEQESQITNPEFDPSESSFAKGASRKEEISSGKDFSCCKNKSACVCLSSSSASELLVNLWCVPQGRIRHRSGKGAGVNRGQF